MKTLLLQALSFVILFTLFGCPMDDPINPDPTAKDCVITQKDLYVSGFRRESTVLTYDNAGNLSEVKKTEFEGSPDYVRSWTLTYTNDVFTRINEYINSDAQIEYIFHYNGDLPDTITFSVVPWSHIGLYALSYSDGKLDRVLHWTHNNGDTLAVDTTDISWTGQNVSHTIRYNAGSVFEEIYYTYDDRRSSIASLGMAIVEPADYADLSTNNLTSMTRTLGPNTTTSNWTFTYNEWDYPISSEWTHSEWSGFGVWEFEYDCE